MLSASTVWFGRVPPSPEWTSWQIESMEGVGDLACRVPLRRGGHLDVEEAKAGKIRRGRLDISSLPFPAVFVSFCQ